MGIWQIEFFPPKGDRNSPSDYITNLSDPSEKGQIGHRLETLREMQFADWPHSWAHKITDKIFQLTAGHTRLMYCLDGRTIIILHACRKMKRKTDKRDIAIAQAHYERYMSQKEDW